MNVYGLDHCNKSAFDFVTFETAKTFTEFIKRYFGDKWIKIACSHSFINGGDIFRITANTEKPSKLNFMD
jgi:hypothetical protein